MRNIIKRAIKAAGGKLLNLADRLGEPKLFGRENIFGLDQVAGIYPTTILSALRTGPESSNRIMPGRDVYLGRRVELEARGPGGRRAGRLRRRDHHRPGGPHGLLSSGAGVTFRRPSDLTAILGISVSPSQEAAE